MLDSKFLKEKLTEAAYDPVLGVRVVHLIKTHIGGVEVEHVVVQMDAGKGLRPHVHEHNGEVGIPITKGVVRFGNPVRDESGEYVFDNDEVKVDWEEPMQLEPGKSFEVPEGKAHDFYATDGEEFVIFFILPSNHLGEDRKFVTRPQK